MKDIRLKFYNFKIISSTNDKAKELAKKRKYNLVVTATKQKKGHGRFGRKWNSEFGGLYMTILLKEGNLGNVKYLTFIAAVAVARVIRKIAGLNAKVKWPNDVLINNKKICGILTETISGKENYALVGIGVNVNQKIFSRSIIKKSTSLKIESNNTYNINNILKLIIKEFSNLHKYYKSKSYDKIIGFWKQYSHTLGKKIRAKTLSGDYIGEAIKIDKDCSLLLRLKNGSIKKIVEGDIFTV